MKKALHHGLADSSKTGATGTITVTQTHQPAKDDNWILWLDFSINARSELVNMEWIILARLYHEVLVTLSLHFMSVNNKNISN